MAEPTGAEVQHLADVIAAARLHGEPLDTHLARIILAAGYRFVDIGEFYTIGDPGEGLLT